MSLLAIACESDGGVIVVHDRESSALQDPVPETDSEPQPEPEDTNPEPTPLAPEVPANPTPADITDLVLITGQSNALGAGTDFDHTIDAPNKRVFAYTSNGWEIADLHQVWDLGWFPRTNPGTDPSNNFSLHFGKKLAELDSQRVVGFILITAPGKAIKHWGVNGKFFNEIRDKVSNAINELPAKSSIDGILWHQGESDGRDDDSYSGALYELIANFRNESWYEFEQPFICGDTATSPVNQQLRKLNRDQDPWTACILAQGLPTRDDGAHFNAEALRIIGERYADKFFEMTQ